MVRHQLPFLLGLTLATVATPAAALPASLGTVDFTWVAPDECPTQDQIVADARSLVTREPTTNGERILARGVAEQRTDDQWRLTMTAGGSTRTVVGATCEEVARAAALFIALLVDPMNGERNRAPPKATRPARPTVRPPPSSKPPAPPRGQAVTWEIGAGLLGDAGMLPDPTALGVVAAAANWRLLRIGLGVSVGPGQTIAAAGTTVARLTPGMLSVSSCLVSRAGRFDWGPCLESGLGIIRSRTENLQSNAVNYWAWWDAGASIQVGFRAARTVSIDASVGAAVPLVKPSFEVTGMGVVHEPGISGRARLLVSWVL